MEYEYININGYGVLVDKSAEKKYEDCCYCTYSKNIQVKKFGINDGNGDDFLVKVIFAEKEIIEQFKLVEVPILPNWREWELEKKAMDLLKINEWSHLYLFGYPTKPYPLYYKRDLNNVLLGLRKEESKKAKWTDEDLIKAIEFMKRKYLDGHNEQSFGNDEIIQSLQKYPKYIAMEETPIVEVSKHHYSIDNEFILITNSEGKQEGIIKEIIYEI